MIDLQYEPATTTDPQHPTWDRILGHCGRALDDLLVDGRLESYGIMSGQDYLTSWIASMIREPGTPLPYLFFYGYQNCGKSMFREAVDILFNTGSIQADHAIYNEIGWNSELKGAIFCYLEELGYNYGGEIKNTLLERLRDYVTQVGIPIQTQGKPIDMVPNLTHWCHMATQREDLLYLDGYPTTIIRVGDLEVEIPKYKLYKALKVEASQFMTTLMNFQLPLSLPAVSEN